jgi:hypothetical protein
MKWMSISMCLVRLCCTGLAHVNGGDIVTEDKHRRIKGAMKLLKQLAHPTALSHNMGHSAVLSFRMRT